MPFAKRSLATLLAVFFALGIFAYSGSMVESSHTMGDGTVHHVCPLMGNTLACVSIFEHISHWQSSFVAVLTEMLPLVVLLSIACTCLWLLHHHIWELKRVFSAPWVPPDLLRSLLPRHVLQEAFSNGLIHPKTY